MYIIPEQLYKNQIIDLNYLWLFTTLLKRSAVYKRRQTYTKCWCQAGSRHYAYLVTHFRPGLQPCCCVVHFPLYQSCWLCLILAFLWWRIHQHMLGLTPWGMQNKWVSRKEATPDFRGSLFVRNLYHLTTNEWFCFELEIWIIVICDLLIYQASKSNNNKKN